jgi:hypothetical protein
MAPFLIALYDGKYVDFWVQLLYKVMDLFPDSTLASNQSNPTTSWTFPPGTSEYPFQFKVFTCISVLLCF